MKTKLLLVFFAFTAISTVLPAQQYWQPMSDSTAWGPTPYYFPTSVYTDHAGNVYVAGPADNPNTLGDGNYSIWEWNGTSWSQLSDGSNINSFGNGQEISICGDLQNNIYAIYFNVNENPSTYYVTEWNGSQWSLLDNSRWHSENDFLSAINSDQYGNIYAAVGYDTAVYGVGFNVYEWTGNYWSQLGMGFPALDNQEDAYYSGITSLCADKYGNVYAAGLVSSQPSSQLANIMVWNNHGWNPAMYKGDTIYGREGIATLCADTNGNVYAGGNLVLNTDSNYGAIQWNGSQWIILPNANNIYSLYYAGALCVDYAGNLYATNGSRVYSWSGGTWNQLGDLSSYLVDRCNSTSGVYALAASTNGIVYTSPSFFTIDSSKPYLLQYNTLAPGQVLAYIHTNGSYSCSGPGVIGVTANGGTPPYQYQWSNNQTGDTIYVYDGNIYTVTITDAQNNQATTQGVVCNDIGSTITGMVFEDVNNNCKYDSTDKLLPNIELNISFKDGATAVAYSNGGGYSFLGNDSGTFTVSVTPVNHICNSFNVCFVNGDSTGYLPNQCSYVTGPSVALTNYVAKPDLTLQVGWTAAEPGFSKQYWVMPYNLNDNPPPDSVTIVFNYDPNLVYTSAEVPLPVNNANAHTLTWVVPGSDVPYNTWSWTYDRFNCFFSVPASLSPSYVLQSTFTIEPTSTDCDSANNTIYIPQVVTGSHDPNEKDVYPTGSLDDADTVLTYTIYYQNTGTATTQFVIVTDTLSSYLQPNTAVNLASSNNYTNFTINGNILTWTFNPLQLPDSSVNNSGSKGFIIFKVNRTGNLVPGIQITNQAAIQFDHNSNVFTNTVSSAIAAATGITTPGNNISAEAYPNPFNDVTHMVVTGVSGKFDFMLYDVTGRLQINTTPSSTKFDVRRNELASGVYLYGIVQQGNIIARGKLVVK